MTRLEKSGHQMARLATLLALQKKTPKLRNRLNAHACAKIQTWRAKYNHVKYLGIRNCAGIQCNSTAQLKSFSTVWSILRVQGTSNLPFRHQPSLFSLPTLNSFRIQKPVQWENKYIRVINDRNQSLSLG